MNDTILTTTDTRMHRHENHEHGVLCYKSIITGILSSFLVYYILTALGTGIGGFRVAHIIAKDGSGAGLMTGAGVWLGLSAVIALFLGSYFATRVSTTLNKKIGGAHGVVISAVFFLFLMHGAGNSLGSLAQVSSTSVEEMITPSGSTVAVTEVDQEKQARIVGDIGWVLFATFVLGSAASVLGGYEAALKNRKRPMTVLETEEHVAIVKA